jgi:hypothetical protein
MHAFGFENEEIDFRLTARPNRSKLHRNGRAANHSAANTAPVSGTAVGKIE